MAPIDYLSRTLQSLTRSKIHELGKQHDAYESRKAEILSTASQLPSPRERVAHMLAGAKEIVPDAQTDHSLLNIERWVEQARYDSSIPLEKIEGFEDRLRGRLDSYSRKLAIADLYSRLLMEWLHPPSKDKGAAGIVDEGDFLVVEERQKQRLQQLCDQFEATVFETRKNGGDDLHAFLDTLFPDDESKAALEDLQNKVYYRTLEIWEQKKPFTIKSLTQCIGGIQNEDVISEEKQETLNHFLNSPVALAEVADVLNMRFADLRNWDWHAGDDGIPVLPRQELNGKYRIWMDDDVLQTIFVEHICVRLCNALKEALEDFIQVPSVWTFNQGPLMQPRDKLRRDYFCNSNNGFGESLEKLRETEYIEKYFLAQLPEDEATLANRFSGYDGDDDDDESGTSSDQEPRSMKQLVLRKIVTETLLQHQLYGQAAVVQSDLHWFGTSIPHSTVFVVLEFLGFPSRWIDFFHKYLEAPLNMDYSFEGHEQVGPRKRRSGLPVAHASEKLIGELVLFFMDLAVNRESGILLYRLHDDLWFSGDPTKCAQAWRAIQNYVNVAGLQLNHKKSGSVCLGNSIDPSVASYLPQGPVRIGFLTLDPESASWVIDQSQVDAHLQQLQTQLSQCDSVISWVRTWNSCIGRFFKNTFGQPAYCFGRPHVDAILATYARMQSTIFCDKEKADHTAATAPDHLRKMIQSRFGISDVPSAFFFYPEELGGLGLRNPFISILMMSDRLTDSPVKLVDDYLKEERASYAFSKKIFQKLSKHERQKRLANVNAKSTLDIDPVAQHELDEFMTFEEWSRFRGEIDCNLTTLYETLMRSPGSQGPKIEYTISRAISTAQREFGIKQSSTELMWVLYLYAEELLETFGGLNLVDKQFLPMGVLDMVKGKKVMWQMVL